MRRTCLGNDSAYGRKWMFTGCIQVGHKEKGERTGAKGVEEWSSGG